MSDEIFFEGKRYISAYEAASLAGFTRDYVARLCREGKIRGRRVGRNWYVESNELQSFVLSQTHLQSLRNESLSQERRKEYVDSSLYGFPRAFNKISNFFCKLISSLFKIIFFCILVFEHLNLFRI